MIVPARQNVKQFKKLIDNAGITSIPFALLVVV